MNLREGTRRLALLLGAAGAIACGFLSYAQLQSTLHQRTEHQRFEQLAHSRKVIEAQKNEETPGPWTKYTTLAWKQGGTIRIEVNSDGVKGVDLGSNYAVASIETQDGQTLYPTPAPGAWSYVLIAILPLLGFFIPWGAIRAIGWVVAGFVQPSK